MNTERGSCGRNIGFLLAPIGSAVGLGNIWAFSYKMGKLGVFTFLLVYVVLAIIATAMFSALFSLDFGNIYLLPLPKVPPFLHPSTDAGLWIHQTSHDNSCFNHARKKLSMSMRPPRVLARSFSPSACRIY